METSREALQECKHLERVQGSWKEGRENAKEAFTISHEHPDQYVTMGTALTTNCKQLLADVLRENREVQYPEWIANTIPIKLASGTWKVQVDYSSLNKVCAKDIQIRMAEDDEEKTGFHAEEGVYCLTHMPKKLKKNSAATLQRMMEKVLADQRGRNVETYLEEIVIKSKSEMDLVQDVKETLRKLKRVNIKIDPTMSSFRVKEGRFLSHMVAEERLRADPRRIHAIILSPTPRKALRRIKRKLSKLQTLAIPKEGEDLMLCLRQRNETISSMLLVGREGIQIPISYEAEGLIVKKFFGQGEQVEETPDANKGAILDLSKGFQANSAPTTRAWRLYLGRDHQFKEGSSVGIILISPKEKMYLYAIRLKFKASSHAIDCEALFAVKEAKGPVVKKFFGQGEQVEETPDANKGGIFNLSKGFQANLTPTTRAWRLYLGRETIKEGSGIGIILISLEENIYSYAIRLKFKASNHAMDYEALLAGLAASANQAIKNLHIFIDSLTLVT
ncbi:reverse transcriptase domain-containing protein [Tanacetum coccineum]